MGRARWGAGTHNGGRRFAAWGARDAGSGITISPMIFQLRQRLLAFGDDFTIRDERGRERYFVDGRAFSIGDKLSFQDMAGNELAFISQRLLTIGKTYEIRRGDWTAVV